MFWIDLTFVKTINYSFVNLSVTPCHFRSFQQGYFLHLVLVIDSQDQYFMRATRVLNF